MTDSNFRFAPELFEVKAWVQELLAQDDIIWMIDYQSIGVMHDDYGIEIEGIPNKDICHAIQALLTHHKISKYINPCNFSSVEDYAGWRFEVYQKKIMTKNWATE